MKLFKIRSSATGDIMGYPDKDEMPQGAKTYCETWAKEQLYGREKTFTSKYTEKGISCEDEAINFAAEVYGWGMVCKNEHYFEDGHIKGTPDLILKNLIPDIKNSWDCFSFPLFQKRLDLGYWWQMQSYMSLTGKKHAAVIYCLMDAPESVIEGEARKLSYKAGFSELELEFYEEVKANMTYSGLPDELRIKRFDVERDDKAIEQIERRVSLCRKYLESIGFKQQHLVTI